ncbi:glutaminyl-peptide cyclotransferase [Imperialibacter roseus]|uniref:Glutaminyl-peptide cyclotransferase n=1 Tax=Imperialibacter roseus TaxID=1324217 RepID=A0ABZ0IQS3_9BACT|nr:glutaminyl-peptide cyclotransferase [Imperialibacter roseus]WOK07365.1 glutaminyl-peptide cyclotransferase [Imperialibacter roseus]
MTYKSFSWLIITVLAAACTSTEKKEEATSDRIDFKIHSQLPHDTGSFTEGFVVHNGKLYESTGEEGRSWFGVLNIKTGKPEKKVDLAEEYFGEGITILNNKVYQLTWKNKQGFVYDLNTFEKVNEFTYETEGWGLTHDGKNLIMSDGKSSLFYLDTASLKVTKTLPVTYQGQPVTMINELEYVNGYIFANIWQTNSIVKIDPADGEVVGVLDLSALAEQAKLKNPQVDVLNGIAWYEGTKSLLVTGKYWPTIYALKLEE